MAQIKSIYDNEFVDGFARENMITKPTTAEVGQMLVVKAVDENGVPTEWEVKNSYTSEEIDQKFGTYVDEMAEVLGGDA